MANFFCRIADAAGRHPERPAIEMVGAEGVATTTYAALGSLSGRFARWLVSDAGVRPGDHVAILGANDARWVAAYLGILRVGAVAVPLDTAYHAAQVRALVTDSGARVIFASEDHLDVARAATASAPVRVAPLTLDLPPDADVPTIDVAGTDTAALLYTSGTTADPKGVVLTHDNLEAERAAAFGVLHVTAEDAVLGVLPLFHALAQTANLLLPLTVGARVVFLQTINSTTLIEALDARAITVFACVPQFFYLIHQRVVGEVAAHGILGRVLLRVLLATTRWLRDTTGINPGHLLFRRVHRALGRRMRLLITGGSRFDPRIARDLHGLGLTVLNGYGLTETTGAATLIRPGDRFTASVGQPLPGVEIRIAPDAAALPDRDTEAGGGEILIRGPIVMRGYFGRPDATAEALEGGWLHTGDLGRIDDRGRLFITGRRKDVIVLSSGKNIYPEEIEAHYRQSPFVAELCVMGLTTPDQPAAERLHAVIVPDTAALHERGTVNVRELLRFEIEGLSVQVPAHKRILTYDIVLQPLPRTTTGKLRRAEIAREWGQHRATAGDRPLSSDDQTWLGAADHTTWVERIAHRLGRPVIRPDDNLELDLHLDSIERVELLTWFEGRTGTTIAPEVSATIFTVRQLVDAAATGSRPAAGSAVEDSDALWASVLAAGSGEALERALARPTATRTILSLAVLRLARFATRAVVRLRVTGLAHLPAPGHA